MSYLSGGLMGRSRGSSSIGSQFRPAQRLARGRFGIGRAAGAERQEILRATTTPKREPSPEVMGIFSELAERYKPGGEFGKHELALLARAKKKHLARAEQQMVSRGLSGTTVPMAEESRFEEERGDPLRARLEDIRTTRLGEVMRAKAGYLGGFETQQIGREDQMRALRASLLSQRGGGGQAIIAGAGTGGYAPGHAPGVAGGLTPTAELQARAQPFRRTTGVSEGAEGAGPTIPEGGRIIGRQYFPPTRFTRNVPQLNLQ